MNIYDKYYRVYAGINLDNIEHNLSVLKKQTKPGTKLYAVVKTDGYGHGADMIAKYASKDVDSYAVATIDEGIILRSVGVTKPILILGYTNVARYKELIEYDIRPSIFKEKDAKLLSETAIDMKKNDVKFHIKLDTGMGRIGFRCCDETIDTICRINELSNISIEGLFTHFASSDIVDKSYASEQLKKFTGMVCELKKSHVDIPIIHCCNSAALIDMSYADFDAVRAGIAMYGLQPSDEVNIEKLGLKQAMSIKSHIVYIKDVEIGESISYGMIFTASRRMRVATVPVGYGDGYFRNLTGRGYVLVRGKKAPIIGKICMDQFMIDVTDIEAYEDDVVTLAGEDNGAFIDITELAKLAGTFNYEFICDIGKRVPRIFYKDGEIVDNKDYFE